MVVIAGLGLWEALARDDLPSRPLAISVALLLPLTLLIRRQHPFLAFALTFATFLTLDVVTSLLEVPRLELNTGAFALLLLYALFRWGSGAEALVGLAIMAGLFSLSMLRGEMASTGDVIGAGVVFLFPAVVGASVRFRADAQQRELVEVRLRERERLARELHDTVAHHVSAIAIQAQAGRAVAGKRPEATAEALAVIEEAASRTLDELRSIVGALREDDDAERAPQAGIADLEALARQSTDLAVTVTLDGDVAALRPSMEAALFRIGQEALTNARRHARGARAVLIAVEADVDDVTLIVTDDGEAPIGPRRGGYGLVGMMERAALLGGTLSAGPGPDGGWVVAARLPRKGPPR